METIREQVPLFTEDQIKNLSMNQILEVLTGMNARVEAMENQAVLFQDRIKELEFLNALLSDRLTLAQRKQFGASSEKYAEGYEQLNFFNEAEAVSEDNQEEPAYDEIHPKPYRRKKGSGKKEEDLSGFDVVRIEHKLIGEELNCPECGTKRKVVATETHKYLRFVPARFETVEEIVYVYSCPGCSAMERAPKDPSLLKGSIATPSLVAAIMNGKYVNGLPLYRQRQEFERYGLFLSDKTMANWMIRCSEDYLFLIYDEMKECLLQIPYLHCDETRIQVLDEPEQKAETKNWMWVYMADAYSTGPQMVIFQYERTRGGYHPKEFLSGYEGYLTTDGYQPYHGLPEEVIVTGCMTHSRRRFDKALTASKANATKEQLKKTVAYEAMSRIGMLYKIEEMIAGKAPDERYNERQKQSKPLLDAFFAWLHSMDTDDLSRSSLIGDAILYTLGQEAYLRRYLEDGHLSIDNSACERAIKPFAIGRRNWLFAKSIRGAQSSAIIYSITETAKLNGLRPYNYLVHIFETMRGHQKDTDYNFIEDLLPWSSAIPEECRTITKSK